MNQYIYIGNNQLKGPLKMEQPERKNYPKMDIDAFEDVRMEFQFHLDSLPVIEVVGNHNLKEGEVYRKGEDFSLQEQFLIHEWWVTKVWFNKLVEAERTVAIPTGRGADSQSLKSTRQIIEGHLSCTCAEAYKSRDMVDPGCVLCEYGSEIELMMQEHATQWEQENEQLKQRLEQSHQDYLQAKRLFTGSAAYLKKREAVAFGEWIWQNGYSYCSEVSGYPWQHRKNNTYSTTRELYELFLKEQQIKKELREKGM